MSPDDLTARTATVRHWLAQARHIAVLSGAGVSAESGVPTFRDAQTGLWAQHDPQALASEAGFRADPALVWTWYRMRRQAIAQVRPNAAHHALAAFQQRHPGRLSLITQNVDGLHQKAGSTGVLALHGHIQQDRWLDPCPRAQQPPQPQQPPAAAPCNVATAEPGEPPWCARCGNRLRPAVVWFGECLPQATLDAAEQAAQACELMLVVGTSGEVYPAAGLAFTAHAAGARVVVLNPEPSALDGVAHAVLRGPAGALLPALLDGL